MRVVRIYIVLRIHIFWSFELSGLEFSNWRWKGDSSFEFSEYSDFRARIQECFDWSDTQILLLRM